jgi:phage/plasmid-like protein (TIGR03299 family)
MTIEQGLQLVGVDQEEIKLVPLYDKEWFGSGIPHYTEIPLEVYGVKSSVFGMMATAGNKFTPRPRRELLELAFEITGLQEDGAHLDTIGILGDRGQTFFAYIQVPELVIDPHGVADHIERGLFVAKGYDGKLGNVAGFTAIRVVCENTLYMALGGKVDQFIRVKNTKNQVEHIREAARLLEYSGAVEAAMVEKAETMLGVDGEKAFEAIVDKFWDVKEEGLGKKALSQRERKRETVRRLYDGEDNLSVDHLGKNGYAAYQAFVEFVDHERDVTGKDLSDAEKGVVRARTAVLPGMQVDEKVIASDLVLALAA